jgi:hypothetical protein
MDITKVNIEQLPSGEIQLTSKVMFGIDEFLHTDTVQNLLDLLGVSTTNVQPRLVDLDVTVLEENLNTFLNTVNITIAQGEIIFLRFFVIKSNGLLYRVTYTIPLTQGVYVPIGGFVDFDEFILINTEYLGVEADANTITRSFNNLGEINTADPAIDFSDDTKVYIVILDSLPYLFEGTLGFYGDGELQMELTDLTLLISPIGVETVSGNIVDNTDPANPIVTLPSQSTILIEATLSDLGVSTFDEVTPAKLAEYSATLDIEVGLNQDIDYKIKEGFSFDLLVDEAELFTNLGINDEATFTTWVETNISATPTITDFALGDGRIRCNLSFPFTGAIVQFEDFGIIRINGLRCLLESEELVVLNSSITEITGVNNLTNLTLFAIINSNLTKIENISNLVNLTTIGFPQNNISEIETGAFDNLLNLNEIYLEDNSLTTAEFDKMNTWAVNAVSGGTITTTGNTDNFNTSTTYTTLLGKGWTINN